MSTTAGIAIRVPVVDGSVTDLTANLATDVTVEHERDLQHVASRIPTVVVPTGIEDWPSPWDFSQGDRLIRTARAAALRFLDGSPIDAAPGLYRAPGYDPAEPLTSAASVGGERQDRSTGSRSAS
jgi:hypothetical protein